MELPLLKKLTVPVAAVGETLAVSVSDWPAVMLELEADSVVVVGVVPPVEVPLGFCQKSPQPARSSIGSEARRVEAIAAAGRIAFMCACLLLERIPETN
jgi:pseudouridine-5'-phosphate glycosidase